MSTASSKSARVRGGRLGVADGGCGAVLVAVMGFR